MPCLTIPWSATPNLSICHPLISIPSHRGPEGAISTITSFSAPIATHLPDTTSGEQHWFLSTSTFHKTDLFGAAAFTVFPQKALVLFYVNVVNFLHLATHWFHFGYSVPLLA
jgi:hypothetical protein